MANLRRTPTIFILLIILTACGRVENLAGVELATASLKPTPTPAPTPTAGAAPTDLTNTASKEFVRTIVTLAYPEGWETSESGQSLRVFDPAIEAESASGMGIFIALTRTVEVEGDTDENIAPLIMSRFLHRGAAAGFAHAESAPEENETVPFNWGGHDAALFTWQSTDDSLSGAQIVVVTADKRRFVMVSVQTETAAWAAFEPTWLNIMATFTLDGTVLPFDGLQAAYETTATA